MSTHPSAPPSAPTVKIHSLPRNRRNPGYPLRVNPRVLRTRLAHRIPRRNALDNDRIPHKAERVTPEHMARRDIPRGGARVARDGFGARRQARGRAVAERGGVTADEAGARRVSCRKLVWREKVA